ncbi:cysteine proteinase [Sodiomyces alkalinus F11]|uniref:Cysteine proteinase n=1 Tax=Sodiomyces alkalinus (strain CBS 110278 / VKM F-3762 / F11) TaxID=1314773 RepID=A0A3N2PP88_SODAK|nr:cysteine proteinase [Sodiomyces alkalinus F11]ROT36244.1 cysteine proteinase [Sodiomyces alkalinus F11]
MANTRAGGGGGPNGAGAGQTPLPHIDDLTSPSVDIDMSLPMRKILERVDTLLRQAEADRDFGRPDRALRGYIEASVIAIRMIPTHPEYVSLQLERSDLKRLYSSINKRIGDQYDSFERFKAKIKADNERTGVQPTVRKQHWPGHADKEQSMAHRPPTATGNLKSKPTVHPKPRALHGSAIRPGSASGLPAHKNGDDLIARFSNLRGPAAFPGQDPRIRTHPPKTTSANRPSTDASIPTSIPGLPKAPDAIYSPARGTLTETAASLPTSTRGGLFTRTPSSTPAIPMSPNSRSTYEDYFTAPSGSSRPSFEIPDGDGITPEDLIEVMQKHARILLIDIRDREEFNKGHINWQTVICIEPPILLRDGVTSDSIEESMIIAPRQEKEYFDRRDKFDLIVFYDWDSTALPQYIGQSGNSALLSLQRALTTLSFGKELQGHPRFLKGGLKAWLDVLGPHCLQPSPGHEVSHSPVSSKKSGLRPIVKYKPSNLDPDQLHDWEDKVKLGSQKPDAEDAGYVHNLQEFHKKFPPAEPQSMVSPPAPPEPPKKDQPSVAPPGKGVSPPLVPPLPTQPTLPKPAVPKTTVSGLYDGNDGSSFGTTSKSTKLPGTKASERRITGLYNPHNWCYANSTIQSLRISPGFGRELATREWETLYQIPRRKDEKSDSPRLMVRIVANLFHWMAEGSFPVMKAQTLMDYSLSLCKTPNGSAGQQQFGGNQQQDAQEFISFLMDALHEETNTRRDQTVNDDNMNNNISGMNSKSLLQGAHEWWENHSKTNRSIVDRYWRNLEVQITTCTRCSSRSYRWAPAEMVVATISAKSTSTLETCLSTSMAPEVLDDYQCDKCKGKHEARLERKLARLPELLCIHLNRFTYGGGGVQKNCSKVTWDFNSLNMEPFFIPREDRKLPAGMETGPAFQAPFAYECYAVVTHAGATLHSGHYYTYVRAPNSPDWYHLNDSVVKKLAGGPSPRIYGYGDAVPYLAFFRRKQPGSSGS